MLKSILLLLPVLFGFTQLSVNWTHKNRGTVTFHVTEHDPIMMECEKSGSQVYYRYEYKLCKRRSLWLDSCSGNVVITRSLTWDPISDSYTLVSDQLGDTESQIRTNYTTLQEAVEELATVRDVALPGYSKIEKSARSKYYISAHIKFICKGQTSATLDRLSSIMTLGLVSLGTADSGWIDFPLSDS